MTLEIIDAGVRALGSAASATILVNQLDELFIDANYFLRGLYRREARAVSLEALRNVEQQSIAMLIPAWKEAEVIEQMLEHNLGTLDYDHGRYDIFCGTYANDPETQARVDSVARRARNVHKVVVPHDGPTSKADCLNWVYQGIVLEEQRRGKRFDILLMHDAEDIIHPLALRLYSLLIPAHDFVQTPVFSLELELRRLVAGTYIDEFAEHHLKDMLVRQAVSGLIPSAGVGSAFARLSFEEIAVSHGQRAFNTESLTEDYEIGLKFRLAGKKVCFACRTLVYAGSPPRSGRAKEREEYIATREYFPDGFRASVRQRSRWILGITLQTWEQVGWKGTLPVLYCLCRDRKGLLTNCIVLLAYLFAAYVVVRSGLALVTGSTWSVDALCPHGSALRFLLYVNLVMFVWRAGMKAWLVGRLYGAAHALLSVPRLVLGNLVSLGATGRAVTQYVRHRVTGEPLRWLKTAHAFPSPDVLRAQRPRLGELLLAQQALGAGEIEDALALHRRTDLPLGEVLSLIGALPEQRVLRALGELFDMPTVDPDPWTIPLGLLRRLPEAIAERLDALPLSGGVGDPVIVAVSARLSAACRVELEERLGARVQPALARSAALRRARTRAYRRLVDEPGSSEPRARLGERLVSAGQLDASVLRAALEEQEETGEMLGELLLRKKLVTPERIGEALSGGEARYAAVRLEDIDAAAIGSLGYGFCAFYGLVPLKPAATRDEVLIASAFPPHASVQQLIAERLGACVRVVLAPRIDIRVALAMAGRKGARGRGNASAAGLDQAELDAIVEETGPASDPVAIAGQARKTGLSPIGYLESTGQLDGPAAARARGRALGLPVVSSADAEDAAPEQVLPPSLVLANAIRVHHVSERALVLSSPRPTPRLNREVAALYPMWAIAWRVLAAPVVSA